MIFAAGLGTRFKPWTDKHPKALARVNGKSLLQRNIEYLQQFGIFDVVVNVHHFAGQVQDAIDQHKGWGSTVHLSDESGELLETGGGLIKAADFFRNEDRFVSVNVDMLTDLNLHAMLAFHQQHAPVISIAVTKRKTSRYFLFNDASRLCGWRNESSGEERIAYPATPLTPKAYSCVAVFQPEIFSLTKLTGKFSVVDLYLELAGENTVLGFDHTGDKLVDVGRPASVTEAESLFE